MAAAAGVLRMKLLIDTKSQRVVFAEAGKDVVLTSSSPSSPFPSPPPSRWSETRPWPAASAGSTPAFGGWTTPTSCQEQTRTTSSAPTVVAATAASSSLLLLPPPPPPSSKTFFVCHRCGGYSYGSARRFVTDAEGTPCPNCYEPMRGPIEYISPSAAAGSSSGTSSPIQSSTSTAKGFVQGVVTYTVKDDLTVTPMSSISSITLLRAFAVTDLAALQEKTVYIGNREGLEILKASLQSKNVLTDVALGKKGWSSSGSA